MDCHLNNVRLANAFHVLIKKLNSIPVVLETEDALVDSMNIDPLGEFIKSLLALPLHV